MLAEMASSTTGKSRGSLWWGLMLLSGAAALTYEICWIRMFSVGLGHEMPAMAAVISSFFGGLAIGAWALDSRIRDSRNPVIWYVALEATIGVWAIITVKLIPWVNDQLGTITGPSPSAALHWGTAFFIPLVVLAPATVAMGATVPAMDRIVEGLRGSGRWIGAVYAANTLGAVTGTLGTTFLLLPAMGFSRTILLASTLNFLGAVLAYTCLRTANQQQSAVVLSAGAGTNRIGSLLFLTGVLGIGYEIVGTRVMAQVQENTVYSFASVLSVYLLGTALGAALFQRWFIRRDLTRLVTNSLGLLSATTFLGILILSNSPSLYLSLLLSFGPGLTSAVSTEMLLAALVFGAPTCLMGITFSALAQLWRDGQGGVGRPISINTTGAALASPLFAPLVLPMVGLKWTLFLVSAGYLTLYVFNVSAISSTAQAPTSKKRPRDRRQIEVQARGTPLEFGLGIACIVLGACAALQDLRFVQPLKGGAVLEHRDGVMASVAVVTNQSGDRFLKVNDRFRMGGTNTQSNERRLGHIPLLLHSKPESVLFLGLGTGNTLAAATVHPNVKADAVELVPEVVALQSFFSKSTGDFAQNESINILTGDARRFVRAADKEYDVIVADLFHPARDGSGSLYTREHFHAVQNRLNQGGLFCQWLPLYQMDGSSLRIILRTFLDVFPQTTAYISTVDVSRPIVGLVGSQAERSYTAASFGERASEVSLRDQVARSGIVDALGLFGLAIASREQLHAFAGEGPINTDDHPRITFTAPVFIYGEQTRSHAPLTALLDSKAISPVQTSETIQDAEFRKRLSRYELARDLFLRAEVNRSLGRLGPALDGYVKSAQQSPDFLLAPAMATIQAKALAEAGKRKQAIDVLNRVLSATPQFPDARALLEALHRQ